MLPLPVHSYSLTAPAASSARLVNVYAEAAPQGAPNPVILRTAPGVRALATLTGGGRGLYPCALGVFAVAGQTLYRIASTATAAGTITGTGRATFADNLTQLAISADGVGYVYSGGTAAAITDGDFVSRSIGPVVGVDGYALWLDKGSGRFFGSDLLDFASYDALDFATAEADADRVITSVVTQRQVALIGEKTTELWYNSGATGFPFERVPGGVIDIGGLAEHGACRLDNTVFWLASDRTARALRGATPQRVSTHGVEDAWRKYDTVSDCQCFPITQQGHLWVVFRFPSAGAAWVYDVSTNEWHERESYLGLPWRVCAAAEWQGVTYVQDAETGSVGVLDASTFTEWGATLRGEWTYQPVYGGGRRMFHEELELGADVGIGLATGQGSDPLVTLQVSDDSGKTWRTLPLRSMGRMGQYERRIRWHRLGSASRRVYRMSVSDPVPVTITDTQLRAS